MAPEVFAKGTRPAPSDRVVIGLIGAGGLGRRHHLNSVLLPKKRVEVGAICDVDRLHLEGAQADVLKRSGRTIPGYNDFRDLCDRPDIDAVLIAVPDHWHALVSIYAASAGKDVYCEKPLSYTIAEGRAMVEAARRYGTVFQTGSQRRCQSQFRKACQLVRNGKIGKLLRVDTHLGPTEQGKWETPTAPPSELDWNLWLGPAPYMPYTKGRCHYSFRWFSDYSGGKLTDWGAHFNDIAQWGIGADHSGPVKVRGQGRFYNSGPHDVASEFHVTCTYDTGVELHCHSDGDAGVRFTGSDGWIFADLQKIDCSNPELLRYEPTSGDVQLYWARDHHDNWLDCIASRERPVCDVEIGHRSATVCHLGNIAVRLRRELTWDPKIERFVSDDEANRMLARPMRAPWRI